MNLHSIILSFIHSFIPSIPSIFLYTRLHYILSSIVLVPICQHMQEVQEFLHEGVVEESGVRAKL